MSLLDNGGIDRAEALIANVKAAGLEQEAAFLSTTYWAWIRLTEAYVNAHPYVANPEDGITPVSALCVTDYTLRHWAPLVPGTPSLDDERVLRLAAQDEAWHRAEDYRMRRDAGEFG